MPLRVAVKAASKFGAAYVAAAAEACSRLVGVCRALSPPFLPLPSPLSFCLLGVFLNGILRITPLSHWCVPGRLFVAGNTCPFSFFFPLSLSLSFFLSFFLSSLHLPSSLGVPGCFRHSWEPFLFGVSLDACVIAGSTFASSFLSFSFLPPPSRAACLQAN